MRMLRDLLQRIADAEAGRQTTRRELHERLHELADVALCWHEEVGTPEHPFVIVPAVAGPYRVLERVLTQEHNGFDVWDREYVVHRAPRITNLRQDPFEDAVQPGGASWNYDEWMFRRAYLFVPAQGIVGKFVKSFMDFPPRGLPASFSVGDALKMISTPQHN